MKWRTDKPTANLIVAYTRFENIPPAVFRKLKDGYYKDSARYDAEDITKWADLEEDEMVTDCNELEGEIERYIAPIHADEIKSAPFTSIEECARHFAKWGAEHLKN